MSGLYVHIPFCKQKCSYCDFATTVQHKTIPDYIDAVTEELRLRRHYLHGDLVQTIYLGGGTPGLLKVKELELLFNAIFKYHRIAENAEISIEMNPEDVDAAYLNSLKNTPVNRVSLGVQSFFDDDLQLMNRRHNAARNLIALQSLQDAGYTNISADLIYGLPSMSLEKWHKNLETFFSFQLPHLSAYHLTYEESTPLYYQLKKNKIQELKEEQSILQFDLLRKECKRHGFLHYETSNFAKQGFLSQHNSGYWQQKKYLGIGSAAHSFDRESRQYNFSSVKKYIQNIQKGTVFYEKEILSPEDRYNEYIITGLRTIWGVDLSYIAENFGAKFQTFLTEQLACFKEDFKLENGKLYIAEQAKLREDFLIEQLFYV